MGKLQREHPRQKEEHVQKPRDGEGSDTSEENKGGQRLGARRGKRHLLQLKREVGAA